MDAFTHYCLVGKTPVYGNYWLTIHWDGKCLSLTGVEGPKANGDAVGACGQVQPANITNGWDAATVERLCAIWDEWHLNDMRAGTDAQRAVLKGFAGDYVAACAKLERVGLLVDNGYRYGSAWLHKDVPADVLEWLHALPTSEGMPACWKR